MPVKYRFVEFKAVDALTTEPSTFVEYLTSDYRFFCYVKSAAQIGDMVIFKNQKDKDERWFKLKITLSSKKNRSSQYLIVQPSIEKVTVDNRLRAIIYVHRLQVLLYGDCFSNKNLSLEEEVHHLNTNSTDNRSSNLFIISKNEHRILNVYERERKQNNAISDNQIIQCYNILTEHKLINYLYYTEINKKYEELLRSNTELPITKYVKRKHKDRIYEIFITQDGQKAYYRVEGESIWKKLKNNERNAHGTTIFSFYDRGKIRFATNSIMKELYGQKI